LKSLHILYTLVSAKRGMKSQEMKILMFGWEFPPHITGGLGTACYGLTKSLTKNGNKILFVVPRAYGNEELTMVNASEVLINSEDNTVVPGATASKLIQTGVEIIPIPSDIKPYTSSKSNILYAIENWSYKLPKENMAGNVPIQLSAKKYKFTGAYGKYLLEEVKSYSLVGAALAKQMSFDVIHAHDWLTYQAGIAAKKTSGKPLVIHVHSTEYDRSAEIDPRVYNIEKEGLEKADHIVAVSNWTKNTIVSKYGISESKVSVVHNGIIGKKQLLFPKAHKASSQIVTFLGRITYQKGPKYFIEAARKVLLRLPEVHFVMAGSGDLLPEMVLLVAKHRLSTRFHFTGFMKGQEVDQLWLISDLYVMPSVSEPFGIAPLEAVQSGVPVIISKQSGVAEVLPHAIKIDFWNVDSMANAIYHVLSHQSLSKTLKKKSKETIKRITWDKAAKKINSIYHELTPANKT